MALPLLNRLGFWYATTNTTQPNTGSPISLVDGTGTQGDAWQIVCKTTNNGYFMWNRDLGSGMKTWIANEYIYYDAGIWKMTGNEGGSGTCCNLQDTTTAGNTTDRGIIVNTTLGNNIQVTNGAGTQTTIDNFRVKVDNPSGATALMLANDILVTDSTNSSVHIAIDTLTGAPVLTFRDFNLSPYTGVVSIGTLSINRKYALPDKSGTIALLSDIPVGGGTVTSVDASGSTGISVSGGPITTSGVLTITNTAPDRIVAISGSTSVSVTGTYPNFVVTDNPPSGGDLTGTYPSPTIGANKVTYGKMQQASVNSRLLGSSSSGTTDITEITLGAGISLSGTTLSATGSVSSVSNSDTTLTISPTTGAVIASINLAAANTWTGVPTVSIATTTTPVDGLALIPTNVATAGNPKYSPALRLRGYGWNTTTAALLTADWYHYLAPNSSTNPAATLTWAYQANGGAISTQMALSSVGNLTLSSITTSGTSSIGPVTFTSTVNLTLARKLNIPTGTNAITGTATLVAGTVVVNTTSVTASSQIFLTAQETGVFTGSLRVSARTAGTSFTILSTVLTDTASVAWFILN